MTDDSKPAEVNWSELRPQLIKIALELGPLLIFFFVNGTSDIFTATAWFMGAMVVSLALSWLLLKKIAIMPLVTGSLAAIFGLTSMFWVVGLLLASGAAINRDRWRQAPPVAERAPC